MEATNGHTDAEYLEPGVQTFETRLETGEAVSMVIRQSGELQAADLFAEALAVLEREVDKTELKPFAIVDADEATKVGEALLEDERQKKMIADTLKPFSDLAYKVHRTITGKTNEYASYPQSRVNVREQALKDWRAAEAQRQAEEDERLRAAARADDERRRKEEADALIQRAKKEGRPDLKRRAEEIRSAPAKEVAITGSGAPSKRVAGVKGLGAKKVYVVEVTDADALIFAIGRPQAFKDAASYLEKALGKKAAKKAADLLRAESATFPQIPTTVVEPVEARIKDAAKATNGRINWPGVAVDEDEKLTKRTR